MEWILYAKGTHDQARDVTDYNIDSENNEKAKAM